MTLLGLSRIIPIKLPRLALSGSIARISQTARTRAALRRLEDHLLDDIGLTRAMALEEAERPVWDAPTHWKTR